MSGHNKQPSGNNDSRNAAGLQFSGSNGNLLESEDNDYGGEFEPSNEYSGSPGTHLYQQQPQNMTGHINRDIMNQQAQHNQATLKANAAGFINQQNNQTDIERFNYTLGHQISSNQ